MSKDSITAKGRQVDGLHCGQVVGFKVDVNYDTEIADEIMPDIERALSLVRMGNNVNLDQKHKLQDAINKLSIANALFTEIRNKYLSESQYNMYGSDEEQQLTAAYHLYIYPYLKTLLQLASETALEVEDMLKGLYEGI